MPNKTKCIFCKIKYREIYSAGYRVCADQRVNPRRLVIRRYGYDNLEVDVEDDYGNSIF